MAERDSPNQNPKLNRREFLRWLGVIAGLAATGGLIEACAPTISPATLPALAASKLVPQDYFKSENQEIRDRLLSEMADLFIVKTNYNVDGAKKRLTGNWTWGFNSQDRADYEAKYHNETFSKTYNAVTHDTKTENPKTFMDMNVINQFKGKYTPDQKLTILKAIVLHEMEQRTIGNKDHLPPIDILDAVTNTILFRMKSNLGFILQTTDGKHTGVALNEAAAEAGARLSLENQYESGSLENRDAPLNYDNLGKLLQPLGISWSEVIKFHRNGDALGFGRLISQKLNYNPDKPLKAEIVGLTLASLAAEGRTNEFNLLLTRLGLKWPPQTPINLSKVKNIDDSEAKLDLFQIMDNNYRRKIMINPNTEDGMTYPNFGYGAKMTPRLVSETVYHRPANVDPKTLPLAG